MQNLEFMIGGHSTAEDLCKQFLEPFSRFIRENRLGRIGIIPTNELAPGMTAEIVVHVPIDDPENVEPPVVVQFKIGGEAVVTESGGKIFCQGTWVAAALWMANFYAIVASKSGEKGDPLAKLVEMARALSE